MCEEGYFFDGRECVQQGECPSPAYVLKNGIFDKETCQYGCSEGYENVDNLFCVPERCDIAHLGNRIASIPELAEAKSQRLTMSEGSTENMKSLTLAKATIGSA